MRSSSPLAFTAFSEHHLREHVHLRGFWASSRHAACKFCGNIVLEVTIVFCAFGVCSQCSKLGRLSSPRMIPFSAPSRPVHSLRVASPRRISPSAPSRPAHGDWLRSLRRVLREHDFRACVQVSKPQRQSTPCVLPAVSVALGP